jgi:hypothetical protein
MLISKMATGFIFLNPLGYIYALAAGVRISPALVAFRAECTKRMD